MPLFICHQDNYGVLRSRSQIRRDRQHRRAATRRPSRSSSRTKGWQLTHILTTHHHGDHVEGNLALKEKFGCTIIGPGGEKSPIPGIDKKVSGGDTFTFAGREVRVIDTPGHTKGHITFHIPDESSAFVGDTLFALGCGRVIEGTMEHDVGFARQAAESFRLTRPSMSGTNIPKPMPASRSPSSLRTGRFSSAPSVIFRQRAKGEMTLPTTIGEELKTNAFLRPESAEIRSGLKMDGKSDAEVFAEIRRRKDNFK